MIGAPFRYLEGLTPPSATCKLLNVQDRHRLKRLGVGGSTPSLAKITSPAQSHAAQPALSPKNMGKTCKLISEISSLFIMNLQRFKLPTVPSRVL